MTWKSLLVILAQSHTAIMKRILQVLINKGKPNKVFIITNDM